jgi:hypothetical protein
MTDHYPAPDEDSREAYGDPGAISPEGHFAPLADPAPAVAANSDPAALSTVAIPVSADAPYIPVAQNQSPPRLYAHKNEVLYAFGGVFFPPLVLFLMGGSRKKCAIMLFCLWPVSLILMFLLFIGVIPLVGMYIWSVTACFREARRQNEAHGFVS